MSFVAHASAHCVMEVVSDGAVVAQVVANQWRTDLAERRQGDGRWGFAAPLPSALRDGVHHRVELRLAGGASPQAKLLPHALDLVFPKASSQPIDFVAPVVSAPAPHRTFEGPPELSIVVNFFNMRREAARTLQSLTRSYQRDIDDLSYEVICIDNGSTDPLEASWIESFGPEFRLFRPERLHPSPCRALNSAAELARGQFIAVMIDGAHLMTPRALAEAIRQLRTTPSPVVALRHWFVGGDQRWLSVAGYSRAMEDVLFDRIQWPSDGYELFRIGTPIGESPNSWVDGLAESNCLFVPAALWRQIGGFNEAFEVPGAGFANLDLLKRAAASSKGGVTCIVGEATFHQYHGGTTTNVSDLEKDRRVKAYAREYRAIYGEAFRPLLPHEVRLAGCMRSADAAITRQRPLYPMPLGVTRQVRPMLRSSVVDEGMELYLTGAYAEAGLDQTTRWLGSPVPLAPPDVLAILEIMREIRPTCVVTTSSDVNLLTFIDSCCTLLGLVGCQIVQASAHRGVGLPGRVTVVEGDPFSSASLEGVKRAVGSAEEVLVLFEAPEHVGAPVDELASYATFVTYGSYIVYLGTAKGQPWLGYSNHWPMTAIRRLTCPGSAFAIDHGFDQHIVTSCPSGYLRRIGRLVEVASDDPTIDLLDTI